MFRWSWLGKSIGQEILHSFPTLKLNLSASHVVSLNVIASPALTLSSASSTGLLSLFLSIAASKHPPCRPLHLDVQGSSRGCSWPRPPLLWAKDSAGGAGLWIQLKEKQADQGQEILREKKVMYDPLCEQHLPQTTSPSPNLTPSPFFYISLLSHSLSLPYPVWFTAAAL